VGAGRRREVEAGGGVHQVVHRVADRRSLQGGWVGGWVGRSCAQGGDTAERGGRPGYGIFGYMLSALCSLRLPDKKGELLQRARARRCQEAAGPAELVRGSPRGTARSVPPWRAGVRV